MLHDRITVMKKSSRIASFCKDFQNKEFRQDCEWVQRFKKWNSADTGVILVERMTLVELRPIVLPWMNEWVSECVNGINIALAYVHIKRRFGSVDDEWRRFA